MTVNKTTAQRRKMLRQTTAILLLVSVVTLALLLQSAEPRDAIATRTSASNDWIGRPFAMISEIEHEPDLAQGDWLILLADHSCPSCSRFAEQFIEVAEQLATTRRETPLRFCILNYGAVSPTSDHSATEVVSSDVYSLTVPRPDQMVPPSRSALHLRDSHVVQVYAPTELTLIHKVFGG